MAELTDYERNYLYQSMMDSYNQTARPLLNFGGNAIQAVGMSNNDVGTATLGGAISGFSQGGLLGGIVGALSSGISAANTFQSKSDIRDKEFIADMKNSGYNPYRNIHHLKNGGAEESEEPRLAQTEKDEVILKEGVYLTKSKATGKHKDLDKGEVTDILKSPDFVFSNNKIKDHPMFKNEVLSKINDIISLSYNRNDGTLDKVKISDVLGKVRKDGDVKISKSDTYAKTALGISKKYKLSSKSKLEADNNTDLISKNTDIQNAISAMPYFDKLAELQSQYNLIKVPANQPTNDVLILEDGSITFEAFLTSIGIDPYNSANKEQYRALYNDYISYRNNPTEAQKQIITNNITQAKAKYDSELAQSNKQADIANINKSTRIDNRLAGISALNTAVGTLAQNPVTEPFIRKAGNVEEMFKTLPSTMAQSSFNRNNAQITSLAQQMLDAGYSPDQIQGGIAKLYDQNLAQNDKVTQGYLSSVVEQDRAAARYLTDLENTNTQSVLAAEDKTRTNTNKLTADLFGASNTFIDALRKNQKDKTNSLRYIDYINRSNMSSDIPSLFAGITPQTTPASSTIPTLSGVQNPSLPTIQNPFVAPVSNAPINPIYDEYQSLYKKELNGTLTQFEALKLRQIRETMATAR